ncbi:hypothetical protein 2019_scaffold132_00056 [Bacteriophage sp.]|nr:hypothetical protein 2019_scaffold132_00056 [Bacteriophage sp.]
MNIKASMNGTPIHITATNTDKMKNVSLTMILSCFVSCSS